MDDTPLTQQDINNIRFLTRSLTQGLFPRMTDCARQSAWIKERGKYSHLIFVLAGRGEITYRGGKKNLRANRLLFFYDFSGMTIRGGKDLLFIRVDFLLQETPGMVREEPDVPEGPWFLIRDLNNPGRILTLFDFLFQLKDLQVHPLEQRLSGSLIHSILGGLYEEIKHPWEQENLSLRKIREICQIMDENPLVRFTVEELAEKVSLSSGYLGHLFKETVGLSPYRYQLQVRMARAGKLLREDRLTVARTAELCGYANPYVFSRVFKEITGTSPGRV